MGVKATHEVFTYCESLKGDALVVMLALADWCNDNYESWPSLTVLAKKSRLTVSGLCRILKRLEGDGYLEIERHDGRGNNNIYRIYPQPKRVTDSHSLEPSETVTDGQCLGDHKQLPRNSNSRSRDRETVILSQKNSDRGAVTYKVEPSIEPSIDISLMSNPQKISSQTSEKKSSSQSHEKKLSQEQVNELYWLYPKHEDKRDAIKAIFKAFEEVVRGKNPPDWYHDPWPPPDPFAWLSGQVSLYAKLREGEDDKYTPLPTTWFNKRRFTDNIAEQLRKKSEVKANGKHSEHEHGNDFTGRLDAIERKHLGLQIGEREYVDRFGG